MKKIIIYLFVLLIFTPFSCQNKTENNKKMDRKKFVWEELQSCPLGYPIQVYKGGIGFKSLTNGLCTGVAPWGTIGHGMSKSADWMPQFINVIWLSFAEDCFYHLETPIDHNKLYNLFKKGFEYKVSSGTGEIRKGTYNGICTGFAPGGVVVIWAVGPGRQTEIGRYQSEKIIIPDSEIAQLDSHDRLLFDAKFKDGIMKSKDVIPLNVQQENKNKPIPVGLWDTYRKKYSWKPVFNLAEAVILNPKSTYNVTFVNGEADEIFNEKFPLTENEFNAIPKRVDFSWKAKDGKYYAASSGLEEKSAFKAFDEVYGKDYRNITAELVIKVNVANTFFTVKLKGSNGKEVFINTENLEVFEATIFN